MTRFIRHILYDLKKQFGRPIRILSPASTSYDLVAGTTVRTYNTYNIMKAIVLPTNEQRDFVYDLAFIAANKNFTTGGYFGVDALEIIVDLQDLPVGVSLTVNEQILIGNRKYQVARVRITEGQEGVQLSVKGLPEAAYEDQLSSTVALTQGVTYVHTPVAP